MEPASKNGRFPWERPSPLCGYLLVWADNETDRTTDLEACTPGLSLINQAITLFCSRPMEPWSIPCHSDRKHPMSAKGVFPMLRARLTFPCHCQVLVRRISLRDRQTRSQVLVSRSLAGPSGLVGIRDQASLIKSNPRMISMIRPGKTSERR